MMSKILKFFKQLFHRITSFIDKKIVVPITKLVVMITSKFDRSGRKVENWLSKTNTLLFISLFLAVAIFIVIDQKIIIFTDNNAEVLKDQPVKVIYNEEAYVIEGLPSTVDITLIGSKTDLYIAKQSSSHDVTVDLTGLKPGSHKVNIEYNQNVGKIDYMVNPSVATVIIYQKVSESKTLTVDLFNRDSLDPKLVIEKVNYGSDKVVIKGAEHQLKNVATVKALVDIKNLPTQTVGTNVLKDVPLKAYDQDGNVVDVEIVPSKIDVELEITSPSKEIPIKVVPKGEVAFGKAISAMTPSENKVTVYGDTETLASLNSFVVEVDVSDLKEDKEYKLELQKPNGVTSLSINNLTVKVNLDSVSNRELKDVALEWRNLDEDKYTAQLVEAAHVDVSLKGVATVVENIKAEDVTAYVDLSGYGPGTYDVDVVVEGSDLRVQYAPKVKKIKILISAK